MTLQNELAAALARADALLHRRDSAGFPEAWRKASDLMELCDLSRVPVVPFVDCPCGRIF